MTYDLRRLRLHGRIERIPRPHRYRPTETGLRTALFFTRTHARLLRPGGRLLSLDFDRPAHPLKRGIYLAYLTAVGSTLGWILHRDPDTYRYIPESIKRYPGADGVAAILERSGFRDCGVVPLLGGFMAINVARKAEDGGVRLPAEG